MARTKCVANSAVDAAGNLAQATRYIAVFCLLCRKHCAERFQEHGEYGVTFEDERTGHMQHVGKIEPGLLQHVQQNVAASRR